jgi:hypothetical protein
MHKQKINRRRLVERFLEDESLTAGLVDPAASALLDWAIAQAEALRQRAEELPPDEWASQRSALHSRIKHVAERAAEAAPEAQIAQVHRLLKDEPECAARMDDEGH